ncbi:hypothetical protein PVAP13_7NG349700 [Panicum virgatum]|uniref:Uncharacterized protein n=1 Tax=Panicum virgatum TaxID=38727 RepID=A0A8T0Q2M3_PANVG|nr:hypothetical protein PVAP13_7NG349700 [Panicum virgatum]
MEKAFLVRWRRVKQMDQDRVWFAVKGSISYSTATLSCRKLSWNIFHLHPNTALARNKKKGASCCQEFRYAFCSKKKNIYKPDQGDGQVKVEELTALKTNKQNDVYELTVRRRKLKEPGVRPLPGNYTCQP